MRHQRTAYLTVVINTETMEIEMARIYSEDGIHYGHHVGAVVMRANFDTFHEGVEYFNTLVNEHPAYAWLKPLFKGDAVTTNLTAADAPHPLAGARTILHTQMDDALAALLRAAKQSSSGETWDALHRPYGTDECALVRLARRAESIHMALDAVNLEIDRTTPIPF